MADDGSANEGPDLAARVGAVLRDERAERRMSQATLARRAATTQQRVSLIERGAAQPTTALLDRLFAALGLQVRVDAEPLGMDCDRRSKSSNASPRKSAPSGSATTATCWIDSATSRTC